MSIENSQSLTGPTLDPLGSDGRPLSDSAIDIFERVRGLEALELESQINGLQSSAKEN
jgi:hypothetical protein